MEIESEGLTIFIEDESAAVSVHANTENECNPYAQSFTNVRVQVEGLTIEFPYSVACELLMGLCKAVGYEVLEPKE